MIFVRDDDVLIPSSGHEDALKHFKAVHEMICQTPKLLHVPTLLVEPLQRYPEAVDYIIDEMAAKRMSPQIHGYEHIDYAKLSQQEVEDHLNRCHDFFWTRLNKIPARWYTPWGANAPHLYEAANNVGLELVDCSKINKLPGRYGIVQLMRDGKDIEKFMQNKEIFFHWWENPTRLRRVVETLKHGSFQAAYEANKDWF